MPNRATVLDGRAVESIHTQSLEILSGIGIHVPDPDCLTALAEAGADVDRSASVARIPARLVEDALARCGRGFALHGRDSGKAARFGCGGFIVASSPGQFAWLDSGAATRREPGSADL